VLFEEHTFSLRLSILGLAGEEIATLPTGFSDFILNDSSPPIDSLSNACNHWGVCGETYRFPLRKYHPMLLAMVGPEESIRMGKTNCHSAIVLPQISRYQANPSTYLGLVAAVAGQMV
jgi:hypothetical protein